MLVEQSKYQAGDIINLKLMSGDEIVGELVSTPTANYELRKFLKKNIITPLMLTIRKTFLKKNIITPLMLTI